MALNDATGWRRDKTNNRVNIYYLGTLVGYASSTYFAIPNYAKTGSLSPSATVTAGTSIAATTTLTAGTGLTVTSGGETVSAADSKVTAGNVRLGVVSAFATTEPTSTYIMKVGTNPVGAITTSGAVFTTTAGATISKIIADGTVSQIEA